MIVVKVCQRVLRLNIVKITSKSENNRFYDVRWCTGVHRSLSTEITGNYRTQQSEYTVRAGTPSTVYVRHNVLPVGVHRHTPNDRLIALGATYRPCSIYNQHVQCQTCVFRICADIRFSPRST